LWRQDQRFSHSEKQQLMGRLNRGDQQRTVIVYDLVAADSCDVVLNCIARDKKDCVSAFLSKDSYVHGVFIPGLMMMSPGLSDAVRITRGHWHPTGHSAHRGRRHTGHATKDSQTEENREERVGSREEEEAGSLEEESASKGR
jgi:hypothetical protein